MVPLNIQMYSNILHSSSDQPERGEMLDEIAKYIWHRTRSDKWAQDNIFFKQKRSFILILFIKNDEVKQEFIAKAIVIFFLIM